MEARRVHERYERRLKVEVVHPAGTLTCVSQNVSLGGLYLISQEQIEYGTEVTVSFHVPEVKQDLEVKGVVRWANDDGFGVQFGTLRAKQVWTMNKLLAQSPKSLE